MIRLTKAGVSTKQAWWVVDEEGRFLPRRLQTNGSEEHFSMVQGCLAQLAVLGSPKNRVIEKSIRRLRPIGRFGTACSVRVFFLICPYYPLSSHKTYILNQHALYKLMK